MGVRRALCARVDIGVATAAAPLALGWQPVDELGLEVGEGLQNISYFIDEGWLPGAVLGPLLALDAHLEAMSGVDNAHLWTVPALRDAPEWAQARQFAVDVLFAV